MHERHRKRKEECTSEVSGICARVIAEHGVAGVNALGVARVAGQIAQDIKLTTPDDLKIARALIEG